MTKDRHYLRVKGWKKIFQAGGPKNQAGVAILTSLTIERTFHTHQRSICQDDLSILNIYTPNARALTFVKQTNKQQQQQQQNVTKAQNTH